MRLESRSGAVLVLTLLLLVVLDCVLVGMLEVARQQRGIADSRAHFLQLQLAAEGAARRALAEWPAVLDSVTSAHDRSLGIVVHSTFEPLARDLVIVTGTAASSHTRARYAASLLARPPAIPPFADVARSAVVAEHAMMHAGSVVSSGPPDTCTAGGTLAVSTVQPPQLLAGALVHGPIALADTTLPPYVDAIADRTGVTTGLVVAVGDTVIDHPASTVFLAQSSVRLTGAAEFRGLLIARGDVHIDAGAAVVGAVRAGGQVYVHGSVTRDGCAVEAAIRAAGLRFATAIEGRAWLPAF